MNKTIAIAVAGLLFSFTLHADQPEWKQVPQILKQIVAPKFPARDFVITDFGAVADGKTDCTKAIAKAIAACAAAGGGRVVIPAGEFLTGRDSFEEQCELASGRDEHRFEIRHESESLSAGRFHAV